MLRLSSYITIGNLKFRWINDIQIKSSWKELTDTCVIKIPRNIRLKNIKIQDVIKRGDAVNVWVGYNDELQLVFKGYVTGIKPSLPIEISCQDEMWNLKKGAINVSLKNAKLIDVLKLVYSGSIDAYDAEIGSFRISKATPAQILEKLKDEYGLHSFFILDTAGNPVLVCGKIYTRTNATVKYHFNKNVIDSGSLEFKAKEDIKLKVNAISIMPNNQKIEVELGDADGEERTLHFYDLSAEELKNTATREIDRLKYDGYRGTLTAFGLPLAKHGDIADLQDGEYQGRGGQFFIDGVNITFGFSGYRREIQLGPKANG